MKLTGIIYSLPLLSSVNGQRRISSVGGCSYTTKRYDFALVDDTVKKTYFDTFRRWAQMTGPGSLHEFVEIHDLNEGTSHGVPCFLVWHRKFLKDAEDALRRINPNFVFLYWNWSRDHQRPHSAKVWDARYLGTNGRGPEKIVRDGVMFNITCEWPRSNPHLLRRDFEDGNTLPPFKSPFSIQISMDKCRNFRDIWEALEDEIHGVPHDAIGGIKGDASTMYSPNDPFFWMHHMFIDMLWYSWQKKNGKENDYSRTTTESMRPWGVPVADYLDSETYPVCATYDRRFHDQEQPPNVNPQTTRNFFTKTKNNPRFRASKKKETKSNTSISLSIKKSKYSYTSIKIKSYSEVGEFIKSGEIPNFRVKKNAENIPHPDIILESPSLSEKFVKMNHMNETEIREREEENAIMAQAINSQLAMDNPEVLEWFQKMWEEEE
jgi:tyrosinase